MSQAQAVKPGSLFGESRNVVHAARNDWAAFTALVCADADMLLGVTDAAAFTPRAGHAGVRVHAACEGLGRLAVEPVGMVDDDDGMEKADILLSGDYFSLPRRRAHQLRLSVGIPRDCAPGTYSGAVRLFEHTLFGDEEEVACAPFTVIVHGAVMPYAADNAFHLDLWQHVANIARKHETPLFSDEHFAVLEGYVQSLAALGQKAVTVIASEIPWSGQRCFNDADYPSDLFEYNMVRVARDAGGAFRYDYTALARYVELCFRHGIDREIEVFGLANIWMDESKGYGRAADWPDGVRIRYFDECSGTFRYMRRAEEIAAYIAALQDFFARRGWLDRVLVVADEPGDIGAYRLSLAAIRAAAPAFRFKTAINHAEFIGEFKDVVDDYVPILPTVCAEWDELKAARRSIRGRLLYYVCCWPTHPNTFICSPLAEARLLPLLAAYMGMDGFLRWNYTVWPEDPRTRLRFRTGEWWSGDMNFVYPSRGGRPLLSLRYWALKRGIGDFELLRMARDLPGYEELADKVFGAVLRVRDMRDWEFGRWQETGGMYSADWADYERARLLLLEALDSGDKTTIDGGIV